MKTRDLWILLTYVGIQFSSKFGVNILLHTNLFEGMDKNAARTEAFAIWTCFSFITGMIIVIFLLKKPFFEGLKTLNGHSLRSILGWGFIGYLLALFTQVICNLILIFAFHIERGSENTHQIIVLAKLNPAFIVIPSLIAPILEEIIFRGILFKRLSSKLPFVVSALISSIIFAYLHGDIPFFLSYLAIGFLFCYLYKRTNSLLVPIITHMLMNTSVVLAQLKLLSFIH